MRAAGGAASVGTMSTKLEVGATLSRVFDLYREQAAVLLPSAAIVFLLPAIAAAALGTDPATVGLTLVILIAAVVAGYWYQGLVVEAVRDIEEDGRRDFSVGDLFRSAAPFVGALLLAGILAGLGIMAGFFLFIVPGFVLLTWWSLIAPVIVLERASIGDAFRRSFRLVRGNGWRVFAIIVLLAIVQALVAGVLSTLATAVDDGRLSDALGTYLGNILIAPLSAIAATVVYLRLRGGAPAGPQARGFEPAATTTTPESGLWQGSQGPPTGGAPLPAGGDEETHRGWSPPRAPDDPAGRP
jgi:hypothetical protein